MGEFFILIYNSMNWREYLGIDKEKRRYFRIQNSKKCNNLHKSNDKYLHKL